MTTVRFLRPAGVYTAGQVVELDGQVAAAYVDAGAAERYQSPGEASLPQADGAGHDLTAWQRGEDLHRAGRGRLGGFKR